MFISHKSNVIQAIHEIEWQCRKNTKGMSKAEYFEWEETIRNFNKPLIKDQFSNRFARKVKALLIK